MYPLGKQFVFNNEKSKSDSKSIIKGHNYRISVISDRIESVFKGDNFSILIQKFQSFILFRFHNLLGCRNERNHVQVDMGLELGRNLFKVWIIELDVTDKILVELIYRYQLIVSSLHIEMI